MSLLLELLHLQFPLSVVQEIPDVRVVVAALGASSVNEDCKELVLSIFRSVLLEAWEIDIVIKLKVVVDFDSLHCLEVEIEAV